MNCRKPCESRFPLWLVKIRNSCSSGLLLLSRGHPASPQEGAGRALTPNAQLKVKGQSPPSPLAGGPVAVPWQWGPLPPGFFSGTVLDGQGRHHPPQAFSLQPSPWLGGRAPAPKPRRAPHGLAEGIREKHDAGSTSLATRRERVPVHGGRDADGSGPARGQV